jgi:hypothetical protein
LSCVDYKRTLWVGQFDSCSDQLWWSSGGPLRAEDVHAQLNKRSNCGPASIKHRFVLPVPKLIVSNGFDQREFRRPKNLFFRLLNGAGNVSKALIPIVDASDYSAAVGLAFGVVTPSVKEIWGDSSELQRQTFLNDTLDTYTELKRGQSVSKVVFLPRFGIDGLEHENTVEFLSKNRQRSKCDIGAYGDHQIDRRQLIQRASSSYISLLSRFGFNTTESHYMLCTAKTLYTPMPCKSD